VRILAPKDLVARSDRALDDFGRWVAMRRPAAWVLDMVQYTAMSTSARAQGINSVETDDPEVMARQRHLVKFLIRQAPRAPAGADRSAGPSASGVTPGSAARAAAHRQASRQPSR